EREEFAAPRRDRHVFDHAPPAQRLRDAAQFNVRRLVHVHAVAIVDEASGPSKRFLGSCGRGLQARRQRGRAGGLGASRTMSWPEVRSVSHFPVPPLSTPSSPRLQIMILPPSSFDFSSVPNGSTIFGKVPVALQTAAARSKRRRASVSRWTCMV